MLIPTRIPGLRLFSILVAIYAAVWISLEGAKQQVILLALAFMLLIAGYIIQRILGGKRLSARRWVLYSAGLGLFIGLGSAFLTLILMAVKTGLHGHGPEFTQAEIEWVIGQIPLWTLAGLIAGLGLGLLSTGFTLKR
jgi:uncharacterized membrane protein